MSPSKLIDYDQNQSQRSVVINGSRPSPLKINKHSNVIQKVVQRKPPVIIYAHSPKIIHTRPSDFMSLVQKLTGFTPRSGGENKEEDEGNEIKKTYMKYQKLDFDEEEKESCPVVMTDDQKYLRESTSIISSSFGPRNCSFLADVPLFTPNYHNSGMVTLFPDMAHISMPSPSFLELIKDLSEY